MNGYRTFQVLVLFILCSIVTEFNSGCTSSPSITEQLGYTKKDILLIINADDVGLHKDVTDASITAMKFGLVTSGSVMVPCPDFDRTLKIWKDNPNLDLGIHLTLTWRRYSRKVKSLVYIIQQD